VSVTVEFVISGTRVVLGATADVLEGDRPADAYDAALKAIGDQAVEMYEKAAMGRRHPAGVVAAASHPSASAPIPPSVGQSEDVRIVEGGVFSLNTTNGKTIVKWTGERYSKYGLPVWPEVWEAAQVSDEDRHALQQQGILKADGRYAVELVTVAGKERVRRVLCQF
jgi:hypothetical protein